jgi:AMMECR1 domain-containing protein
MGFILKRITDQAQCFLRLQLENGWTVEEFLGFTSRDKAGLGWDGWKDAETLYIRRGSS